MTTRQRRSNRLVILHYGWAHSYSPEALAQAVAALDDQHAGDRVNIFLARL
jgi:hypothetical protein